MVIQLDRGEGNSNSSHEPSDPSEMSFPESDPSDPSSDEPPTKKAKTVAPSRRWIFTWHDYPENWYAHFSIHQQPEGRLFGYHGGEEICPNTGRPHIQGWIDFGEGEKRKSRPTTLKLPKQIHWTKMRGTPEENFKYCSKDGKDISWGTCTSAKPLELEMDWSISPWMKKLYDILVKDPNNRDIWWLWEPIGKAGKTFFCKWYELTHHGEVLVLAGKAHDMKNGVVEWKEKNGTVPRVILINIPRDKQQEHISWAGVEEVKDMIFYSGKFHGGMINDKHPHVVFMANWEPDASHMSGDRYNIVRIPDGRGEGKPKYHDWRTPEPSVEECVKYVPAKFPGFVVKAT